MTAFSLLLTIVKVGVESAGIIATMMLIYALFAGLTKKRGADKGHPKVVRGDPGW